MTHRDLSNLGSWAMHRRAFLGSTAGALGALAMADLLGRERSVRGNEADAADRPGMGIGIGNGKVLPPARAKSVICLFQHGGPSQMDLFDPKPALAKHHGKPYSGNLEVHFHSQQGNVLGSPFQFRRYGESGLELSELLPHTGRIADRICLVRSMTTESVDHEAALRLIHTGKIQAGRPTWGAWTIYGLGSENANLPAYVVLSDPGGLPIDGTRNWSSGWLPAIYQGTSFRSGANPVLNLETPSETPLTARRGQLDLLEQLNRAHLARHPGHSDLQARIANYETAARMQLAVPQALDIDSESAETKALYGLDNPATKEYARRCLLARRLVERGVRFVQIFLNGQPWDTHSKNAETLKGLCARTDQPSAALVMDLERRGLLDSTIVLWTGEFGRLPISQGTDGRDHNRHGFSLWLAGGGFRAGYIHGSTDDFGYKSVQDVVSVHDLQATLLHALGLNHSLLTYPHDGRDESLTDPEVTGAKLIPSLLG